MDLNGHGLKCCRGKLFKAKGLEPRNSNKSRQCLWLKTTLSHLKKRTKERKINLANQPVSKFYIWTETGSSFSRYQSGLQRLLGVKKLLVKFRWTDDFLLPDKNQGSPLFHSFYWLQKKKKKKSVQLRKHKNVLFFPGISTEVRCKLKSNQNVGRNYCSAVLRTASNFNYERLLCVVSTLQQNHLGQTQLKKKRTRKISLRFFVFLFFEKDNITAAILLNNLPLWASDATPEHSGWILHVGAAGMTGVQGSQMTHSVTLCGQMHIRYFIMGVYPMHYVRRPFYAVHLLLTFFDAPHLAKANVWISCRG